MLARIEANDNKNISFSLADVFIYLINSQLSLKFRNQILFKVYDFKITDPNKPLNKIVILFP